MRRVRILQIVAGLDIGRMFGGAERSGLELSRSLSRDSNEFDVTVCSFWQTGGSAQSHWLNQLATDGICTFFATEPEQRRDSSDFFQGARRVVEWCRVNKPDIVHAHHEGGALAGLMARQRGCATAVVRTAHVPLAYEWGSGLSASAFRAAFSRMLFPLMLDAEVSVSLEHQDKLARRAMARVLRRRPHLIHNTRALHVQSVDVARLRAQRTYVIGSIGRLTHQKNYALLIDAMPHVLNRVPETALVLVGDGELRDALQKQARALRVDERVQFLGQRDDVAEVLRTMNVFVLPSLWEGISTVLLESIAAGVPLVASDIPGNRELIQSGRTGWLTPPHDPARLAEAIIEALLNHERAIAYATEAQKILPAFSMATIVEQYRTLYRSLAA